MEEFRHITMITAIFFSGVYQRAIVFAGSGNCELPTIKNADINMTGIYRFSEGTVVHFHCLPGFRPVGDGLYRCANSIWVGSNFSCLIKTCPLLESPKNGEMIGDNFEVGSVMRYKCDIGFELIGSKTSLCKLDSQWDPPNVPECRIKKCLAAPVIDHGELIPENKIEGFDYIDYGASLRARCNSGYMVNGPVRIYCDSKGQWTQIPECRPIACPSYSGLDAKCVRKTTLVDKTLLIIFCTANSTLITALDETASCENSTWNDPTIRCLCDCEIKADTDFVHIENLSTSGRLKHNETLQWSCKNGTTKTINDSMTCIDGTIKPQGWGCFIPSLTSVDPIDSTDSGAVDKSRNENDDALAIWNKARIIFAVVVAIIIFAVCVIFFLVLVGIKYRRGTILEDGDTVDRKLGHEDVTASETHPNEIDEADIIVSSQDVETEVSLLPQSDETEALLLPQSDETEALLLRQSDEIEALSLPQSDETEALLLPQSDETEALLLSQDAGVESPKPSQGHGAGLLLSSQDNRCQTKKGLCQDISESNMEVAGDLSGEVVTKTSELNSNLVNCDEQDSLLTPTPATQKNVFGPCSTRGRDPYWEEKNVCPRCNEIVYPAEAHQAGGRKWHKKCFTCYKCGVPVTCPDDHGGEIYCSNCYLKMFGPKQIGNMRPRKR